jgi:aromatic-L-amino-acid decarboxylase
VRSVVAGRESVSRETHPRPRAPAAPAASGDYDGAVPGAPEGNPLELSPSEMRRLGYAAVDAVIADMEQLAAGPAARLADPGDLWDRLGEPPPEAPADPVALLERVMREVVPTGVRPHHPGMFAYVPPSPTFPGAVADFVAAGANLFAGTWQGGPAAAVVEETVLGWFRDLLGLAPTARGVVMSGGSAANLVAVTVARDRHLAETPDRVAYVSDQSHSSIGRALAITGMRTTRTVGVDADYRMTASALAAAVAADRADGRVPWLVAANAGATNTGAIDELPAIAGVCEEHGLWLHVDGAYGGFAALTDRGAAALRGLELADTLVLDAHKWLFAPLGAGIVYARDGADLERTFAVRPEYLGDAHEIGGVDFADRAFELSRPFRALKIWFTIKTFGLAEVRRAIDSGIDLAALAARLVEASPALELVTPPSLGTLTFRSTRGVPAEAIVRAVAASGRGFLSSTVLSGERVVRMCVLVHRASEASVRGVLEAAESATG